MNTRYLYLFLDGITLLFPLLFSFYPKSNFSKKWKYLAPSIIIPAVLFIIWDEVFTQMGVWGFNPAYLTGAMFGSLPIEEILFFICIPYACVFTYEAINYLVKPDYLQAYQQKISIGLIVVLLPLGINHYDKWYTSVTYLCTAAFIGFLQYGLRVTFLSRFYFAYLFILIPFFIINGILTGTAIESPVVWYNNQENMDVRIGTIPVEDSIYGMLLLMMNVLLFEGLQGRLRNR